MEYLEIGKTTLYKPNGTGDSLFEVECNCGATAYDYVSFEQIQTFVNTFKGPCNNQMQIDKGPCHYCGHYKTFNDFEFCPRCGSALYD